ncbi:UDP-glycosyltransferase 73C5-like [Hibiscus syriacus]|uniref:Glycosyltransferase n=1 Tax=Hibiscus syriacus TaxID=106335 RepID=A0A6A3AE74_HIBSY|nr:UDP-glycosyltransferase 73C5-like [Hibiscus syriacus]
MPRRKINDLRVVRASEDHEERNNKESHAPESSEVPKTVEEDIEIQIENAGTRKTRGHTTLKELYQLPPGHRVKVSRNDADQPIGPESRLPGYLGIVGRNANMLPINYESWCEMPNSNKNQALDFVKSHQECSGTNRKMQSDFGVHKKDRQQQKFTHTPGSKSFACIAHKEENISGSKVGRIQLFDITHTKKDNTPMTVDTAEIMEKLREKKAEYHVIASSQGIVNDDDIENQAINDVLGPERYGRRKMKQGKHREQQQKQLEQQRKQQEFSEERKKADQDAYGVIVNTLEEMEPAYVNEFKKTRGDKVWCIGPVSLCNKDAIDKAHRGNKGSVDEQHLLRWLDSKKQERTKGRGLVVRGWAPQVLILSHPAIGGFLTHCGWNSTNEGISAGVPLINWPLFTDQFANEKLTVQILKIGVRVGVEEPLRWAKEEKIGVLVKKEDVKEAIEKLMDEEERRKRAKKPGEMAKKAVEIGDLLTLTLHG